MFSKKTIRIISLFLAGLMILSAVAVLTQVLAVSEPQLLYVTPDTGDNDGDYIIPAVLIALGAVAVGVCLVLPKMQKKGQGKGTVEKKTVSGKVESSKIEPKKTQIKKPAVKKPPIIKKKD